MPYTYPIIITEHPHRGQPVCWTLCSERHLSEILNGSDAQRRGCTAETLDEYIDWLRSDLKSLDVQESI